jgi:microcystin-dependent protein
MLKRLAIAPVAAAALLAVAGASPARAQSEPYIGEIMFVAFSYCPQPFVEADGRTLPIAQNTALFSLLGWRYGGNGQTTFKLPNLRKQVVAEEKRTGGKMVTRPLMACIAIYGIFPPRPD